MWLAWGSQGHWWASTRAHDRPEDSHRWWAARRAEDSDLWASYRCRCLALCRWHRSIGPSKTQSITMTFVILCLVLCLSVNAVPDGTSPHSPHWSPSGCWVLQEPSMWTWPHDDPTTRTNPRSPDHSDRSTRRWWLFDGIKSNVVRREHITIMCVESLHIHI